MPRLLDKVVVVTGASAGIGLAVARRFQAAGARLVLNARREEPLRTIPGATVVAGDVTDPEVRERIVEACGGRVDLLINNAGYGEPGPVEAVVEERARRQFEVNFFAAAALIRAVLPFMRAQRSGRIITLSSVAGRFGYPLFGWYCASKHALEGLHDGLRLEVRPWGIDVVLIEPGPVRTDFFDVTRHHAEPLLADDRSPYAHHLRHVASIERRLMKQATTADAVAALIEKAATARRPRARYPITAMARVSLFFRALLPQAWFDAALRREFRIPGAGEVS